MSSRIVTGVTAAAAAVAFLCCAKGEAGGIVCRTLDKKVVNIVYEPGPGARVKELFLSSDLERRSPHVRFDQATSKTTDKWPEGFYLGRSSETEDSVSVVIPPPSSSNPGGEFEASVGLASHAGVAIQSASCEALE